MLDPDDVKPRAARPAPETVVTEIAPVTEPAAAPRKARWSMEKKQAHKTAPKAAPRAAGSKSHGAAPRDDRPARTEGAEARPKRAAGFKSHKTAGGWQGKSAGDKPFRAGPKPGKPAKR